MRSISRLLFTGLLICLTSCSFNKLFLQPDVYPGNFQGLTIYTPDDTLRATFAAENYQPTFTQRNGRDTITHDYSIESVVFRCSNGDTLNGWFLRPSKLPVTATLLHIHGNAGSLISQYKAISPLIEQGFQVFLFDYSGFGFSQGKATRKNALANALSALDYLKARPDVKGTKVFLYGQSFGGHLAAVIAEKREQDIDGVVIEGAFSSAHDIAAYTVPIIGRIAVKQSYSAKRSIRKVHKPVLVIHSTEDEVIPFFMGQKIYENANDPKEFYEIRHCHMCGPDYYAPEIAEKIRTMMRAPALNE